MLPLFLLFPLLLFADFGSPAVWSPPANFRDTVLAACSDAGAGFGDCLARQMKSAGASVDALAFTRLIHNEGYIEAFRPVSRVGVAEVTYPFRANENYGNFLVNGQPPAIDVDNLSALPVDTMKRGPAYHAVAAAHPQASLWPGDRSSPNVLLALTFPDGSQQFIADYRVQDGCHACAVLGQAFYSFGFDPAGRFIGIHFSGFSPHFSFSRTVSRKMISVTPGKVFTVVLPANPSTGYSWSLLPPLRNNAVQSLGHKFQSAGKGRPGSSGNEFWTLRAAAAGHASLRFAYIRPWEKDAEPAAQVIVSVGIQ